jgi:hypothetical protein
MATATATAMATVIPMVRRTARALAANRMPADRKPKASCPSVIQMTIGLAAALILAVATFVLTLPFVTAAGTSLFQTADRRVAALASRLGTDANRGDKAAQTSEAKAIIARDATSIGAVRSLAFLFAQAGQAANSVRLLNLAERLSRRDIPTELALIEVAVARGDIAAALTHYDRALTTKPAMADTLIPILVSASANRDVAQPLARMMTRRPVWWPELLDGLIMSGDPEPTARVAEAIALRPGNAMEGWRLSAVIDKLAKTGHADTALGLAQRTRSALTGNLVNGGFENDGNLPPFDWKLIDSEGLAATREEREGATGHFALSLVATSGQSGMVAQQLLLLRPGRYRIGLRAGDLPHDPASLPRITLRCASSGSTTLADAAVDRNSFSVDVAVPAACVGQWLEFRIGTSPIDHDTVSWIDDVSVRPI